MPTTKTCDSCEHLSRPAAGGGNVNKENKDRLYCRKYKILWTCTGKNETPPCCIIKK